MSGLAHGTRASTLRSWRFSFANVAVARAHELQYGPSMAPHLRLVVPSAFLALCAVACSAEDAAPSAQDAGTLDAAHDATNALADTACPGVEPDGAFDPPDLPACPAQAPALAGGWYPAAALPQGVACSGACSCSMAVDRCPQYDSMGFAAVDGWTCTCASGAWSCFVSSLGDYICGDFPDANSPASADGSADGSSEQ